LAQAIANNTAEAGRSIQTLKNRPKTAPSKKLPSARMVMRHLSMSQKALPQRLLCAARYQKLFLGPQTENSGLLIDDLFKFDHRGKSFMMSEGPVLRDAR
jgi:hypothetical protein